MITTQTFRSSVLTLCLALSVTTIHSKAAVITFNTVVKGQTSFGFDGDGDGVNDVIFTTTDPLGFNTTGPGANQTYIHEPGLEGTSTLNPDLRVQFLNGAANSISFGFALNSASANPTYFANFQLFDAANMPLGNSLVVGGYTTTSDGQSSFPEGSINLNFGGIASYGDFNFTSEFGRYIIDDFQGNFGSTEVIRPAPEPTTFMLFAASLAGLYFMRRLRRA